MNMLPTYGSMAPFEAQFFPNYPSTYNASMMSQYTSPVSSFCPAPFYDVTASSNPKSESDSSSSPSAIHKLSPEEQQKYREKRDRNNLAAKQSRIKRSQREKCLQDEVSSLKTLITQLRQENMQWQHQDQLNKATIHQLNQELAELRSQDSEAKSGLKVLQDQTNTSMFPYNA